MSRAYLATTSPVVSLSIRRGESHGEIEHASHAGLNSASLAGHASPILFKKENRVPLNPSAPRIVVNKNPGVGIFSHERYLSKGSARRRCTASRPFNGRIRYAQAVATGGIEDLTDFKEGQIYEPEPGPVIVIDNYDSFTYNLCQYLGDLGCEFHVYRNDDITVSELKDLNPSGIVISPGPGTPDDSGISLETVLELGPTVPMFGVCMGLQCMGQAYGGKIVRAPRGVMHGKTSEVFHSQCEGETGLLVSMPSPFRAARYHSLVIDKDTFPANELEVTAWTSDGLIMGVRHKKYRHVEGVQFHPESIITSNGMKIVENFLCTVKQFAATQQSAAAAV
eukprot:TRINITY_DN732_c0_g1_i5.p1 TRINITY_DN732_c0_g1~~TRINITY_DN732_c0_g1_i5.p1  ORF type:complete len:365 (+),score=55.94 TRINITY_DN732_c0_g1_i5:86-1096(+)